MRNQVELEPIGIMDAWQAPLKIMPANGGPVMRFLRKDALWREIFPTGLAEIYFSEILPGAVKAWKLHTTQNALFCVPFGLIRLVLFDPREDSFTRGALAVQYLGRPDHYQMLRIPARVWYGFQCIGESSALVCNCVDLEHDPMEAERLPMDDPSIPYRWPEN